MGQTDGMELTAQVLELEVHQKSHIFNQAVAHVARLETETTRVLRWAILELRGGVARVEVATVSGVTVATPGLGNVDWPIAPTPAASLEANNFYVSLVVPTGVGASQGGFIGDAGPLARAMAVLADVVVVHPNVVTAADFYAGHGNVLYAEGFALDRFFLGAGRLQPRSAQIGVVLDVLDDGVHVDQINACNAARTVAGLELVGVVVCDQKVEASVARSDFGHFLGRVLNADVLFDAVDTLVRSGADAIAVVTDIGGFGEQDLASHYRGLGPNPVGALEALISRAVSWYSGLPCAHAPAFTNGVGNATHVTDPRVAAEVSSGTGLPSVLLGLSRAARIGPSGLGVKDLSAIVVPFDCAGGIPSLAAQRWAVPLVAVRSNRTAVGAPATSLGIDQLVVVDNYREALGLLACLKAGVSWNSVSGEPSTIDLLK